MAFLSSMEKMLARFVLLITGIIIFIAAAFLIGRAGTMSYGIFTINDPVLLVAGFAIIITGPLMIVYGWKFDEMNRNFYVSFLTLKENGSLNGKGKWLGDRILLSMLSRADRDHDEDTARRWIYLIYFLNLVILLPVLADLILIVVIVWLELLRIFGILGAFGLVFGLLVFVCLIVYAWKFNKINAYASRILSATIGNKKEDYEARVNVRKLVFIIICILLVLSLMDLLAGKFVLGTNSGTDPLKSDIILGTWQDIKNDGTYSIITFNDDSTFSWRAPLVYSRTGYISGRWNNTGDGTHLTYSIAYTDPATENECTQSITLTRAYYHQYGKLVTCYPCFSFSDIPDGGPFSNANSPKTIVPDRPTPIPSSSPAPGQDAIVGTWKNDAMQEFYMYWTFDSDGTFKSSTGGTLDRTGIWKNISPGRYTIIYPDNQGMYVDYQDGKIFNEHAPDLTSSRVSYDILDLY